MLIILYGLLIAHLNSYKGYYLKIFTTFSVTYLMKRLIKVAGQKEHSELIGLGGYALAGSEFVKLLGAINKASKSASLSTEETNKIIGGLLGNGIDWIKELLSK